MGSLVDGVLAQAARRLKLDGLNIAGSIQWNEPIAGRRRCRMTLEDLASGRKILASEDRGSEARGCHLDTSALEEAAVLAAESLEPGIDLVIVNRFGKQEIPAAASGKRSKPLSCSACRSWPVSARKTGRTGGLRRR